MMRAKNEATPAIRKSPQKLSRPRLFDENMLLGSGQVVSFLNHTPSISFIFFPSVTCSIALEMSGTRGEPLGKAWDRHVDNSQIQVCKRQKWKENK